MSTQTSPRVSIGLPVFNGGNFISAAIASILAQTFTDFELIISDNASTDGTEAICRRYALQDDRIRYYRNDRNFGAAANFNRAFELASGEYFKWAAHDDMLAPEYLEKCVAALDAQPDAVLCQAAVQQIGELGEPLATQDSRLLGTGSSSLASLRPPERFKASILKFHACTDVFGLIRADALIGTLLQAYGGSDRALLAELALKGRCIYIQEPLFFHRDYPGRFVHVALRNPDECLAWFTQDVSGKRAWHAWSTYQEFFRMIPRHVENRRDRLRCYCYLLRWLSVNNNIRHIVHDVIWVLDPRMIIVLRVAKHRLFALGRIRRRVS